MGGSGIAPSFLRGRQLGAGRGPRSDPERRAGMASDVAPAAIEQLEERPMSVEPRAIESEFTRIWRETAGGDNDGSSIRLRTLNFVGLANDGQAEAKFADAMQLLVERHPCR